MIDLHVADGGDALVVVVVVDLDRLQQHRRLFALGVVVEAWLGARRPLGEAYDLGFRRRNIQPAAGNERRRAQQDQDALLYSFTPRRRTSAGSNRHQPSSWYSSATKPVMAPTAAGIQAAIIGGSSSALLRSSVSFDMM